MGEDSYLGRRRFLMNALEYLVALLMQFRVTIKDILSALFLESCQSLFDLFLACEALCCWANKAAKCN